MPILRGLNVRDYFQISFRTAWHSTALLGGFILFKTKVADIQNVSGTSMSPTISPSFDATGEEDTILISRFRRGRRNYNDGAEQSGRAGQGEAPSPLLDSWNIQRLKRGDVITFWSPSTGEIGLKRVIALGGDVVEPEKRVKHGKGYRLPMPGEEVEASIKGMAERITVPYGHLWVEGDDPNSSLDSRDYGPISQALVEAKVMGIIAPWKRMGIVIGDRPTRKTSTRVTPGVTEVPLDFLD